MYNKLIRLVHMSFKFLTTKVLYLLFYDFNYLYLKIKNKK